MNNLSWMIYLAGVAGSLKTLLVTFSFFSGVGYATYLLAGNFNSFVNEVEGDGIVPRLQKSWSKAPLLFVAPALAAIIPDQSTVYAIAASEMGENLINTPTAGKAVKALDAWLDRQIGDQKAEPK